MAEVKQVSRSFSLSSTSKKKPPSFSNNNGGGVSSSFKHVYDDVFASSSKTTSNSYMEDDDYAEVFGCSKSTNNGCWSIPYSSIPIIDLPKKEKDKEKDFSSSKKGGERMDYSGVFGGIDDDSFGFPNGEELFDHLNKKAKIFPRIQGQTTKSDKPGISSRSCEQLPTNGFCQSFDNTKRFDPGNNEIKINDTNGPRKAAHVRASSMHDVSATQKPLSSRTPLSKDSENSPTNGFCQSSDKMKHYEDGDSEMTENAASWPRKEDHIRAYLLHDVGASHKAMSNQTPVINRDGNVPTNGFCQSSDSMKHVNPVDSEMMVNAKHGSRNSAHVRAYSLHEVSSTPKSLSSQTSVTSDDGKSSTNGVCQSSDSVTHFDPGDSEMIVNAKSGPRNAAHVRAYSLHDVSDTQKSLSSKTPVIKDDTLDANSIVGKKQGKHIRHTSLDVSANKQISDGDAGLQKVTSISGSNLVEKSHGTCQPSEATIEGLCQSNDNSKHSEYKTNDMKNSQFNGGTHAAEVQTNHEPNHALDELGLTQKTVSNRTSVLKGATQPGKDVDVAEGLVKHSHDASVDLSANGQNGERDAGLQKACGTYESTSADNFHGACQASFEASPSNVVNNDSEVAMGFGKVQKKGRRSRMTSLDLSDYNHSCEHDGGYQRKHRFGSSYSFDALHDPSAAHVKVQPSKMYPSSSLPQFFPVESHYKVSSGKNSQKNMYAGGVDSPPSLAEELDVNSAAAVSAAALQRAIEEAEMRIRWAKAFLERECQGSTNLRFKDTLKVTVAKENGLANEMNNVNQVKMDDVFSSFESEIKPCSPLKRKHITINAQEAPTFENQAKFVNDWEFTEGTDAKVSELMREDQKCEGGEWEAAKHLNQIISGVKNKIVSFMSWQTETEKKEDLKESEINMKHQQHPEEVEHDLQDHEVLREEETEKNQGTGTSADEAMHGEDKAECASEAVESEGNESIRSINSKQEKVRNKVDFTPNTAEPSLPILQFFAFRNQRLYDPPDSEVEEKEPQVIRDSEIENEQEQVVNEVNDEQLPCQGEEASPVELDEECVNQDNKSKDDMSDIGSNDGENDKTVEEPHSLAMHNAVELSHEEDDMNRKGDICSVTEENAEMVEELYSSAGLHSRELTHELDGQDDMCRKSHIGCINEENVEIVQEPFTDEESEQDDVCTESRLGSNNKENDEIVEEFYSPSGNESTVAHEEDYYTCLNKEGVEEPSDHSDYSKITTESADKDDECEVLKEAEQQLNNVDILEGINVVTDPCKNSEAAEGVRECQVNEMVEINTNHIEEFSEHKYGREEIKPIQTGYVEETVEQVTEEASYVASAEEGCIDCIQNQNVLLNKAEEISRFVESSSKLEEAVYPDEVMERIIDMKNEPEIDTDIPVSDQTAGELFREGPEVTCLPAETVMEVDRDKMKDQNGSSETLQCETNVSLDTDTDMSSEEVDVDVKVVEPESQDLENQTDYMHESREKPHGEEYDTASEQDLDSEISGVEAVHRRRRWFDNRGSIAAAERPSILEVNQADLEIDQEVLDESELTGSVEIHSDKLECCAAEVAPAIDAEVSSNQDCSRTNVEITPKRRRWFVNRGEAGVPEPLSLFKGVEVNREVPLETKHETLLHEDNISSSCLDQLNTNSGEPLNAVNSDVRINGENGKQSGEAAPRRKRWFESRERVEPVQQVRIDGDVELAVEDSKAKGDDAENHLNPGNMPILQEKDDIHYKVESKEQHIDMDEVNRREKAKEKEKLAVERAIREARERAFAEARERARREAAEKPNVEGRQKVAAGVQEKLKVSSEGTSSSEKASVEAKLKAERAAVERATAEARERALQKSLSEKAFSRSREQAGKYCTEKNSSVEPKYQSSRSSNASSNSDKSEGVDVESAQRRKARLERQKRTTERAAKALEEKNKRDLVTQKEQAAKNMLADALDAEVRRWSTGKEGNLRALLSTLQHILGPDSGWQPVSLTDLVAATAVRKAYKKATLCVHPDKLQQRGASIQQKHICEKVFDLLKEAWSKFNPDER